MAHFELLLVIILIAFVAGFLVCLTYRKSVTEKAKSEAQAIQKIASKL